MAFMYKPNNLSPANSAIDGNANNTFSWVANGTTQTHYEVFIYNNSTGALVHDSTKTASVNEYYTLTGGTLTNGTEYKWKVQTWSGTANATSDYEFTIASAAPVAAFTSPDFSSPPVTITTQDYNFVLEYTQAQDIPLKKFKFILYDSEDNELSDSGWIYDFDSSYEFTGMVNYTIYKIEGIVVSQYDLQGTTSKKTFTLEYTVPDNIPDITLTPNDINGSITVSWSGLKQVLGVVTGSSSYVAGKFGYGLELTSGSDIEYTENFEYNVYTITSWFKLPYAHDGDFIQIGSNVYIGYEASTCKFYYKNGSDYKYANPLTLYTWEDISGSVWSEFIGDTWADLGLTGTDYCYNWIFIGITPDWIIIKFHNEVVAYIDLST